MAVSGYKGQIVVTSFKDNFCIIFCVELIFKNPKPKLSRHIKDILHTIIHMLLHMENYVEHKFLQKRSNH